MQMILNPIFERGCLGTGFALSPYLKEDKDMGKMVFVKRGGRLFLVILKPVRKPA